MTSITATEAAAREAMTKAEKLLGHDNLAAARKYEEAALYYEQADEMQQGEGFNIAAEFCWKLNLRARNLVRAEMGIGPVTK